MRTRDAGTLAVLTALMAAPVAHASPSTTPNVQSTTLLRIKQDPRDGTAYTALPAYTLFNLHARRMKVLNRVDTDVVVSSWGRMEGTAPADGRLLNGDISLAYLEGRTRVLDFRAGRQLVFDGVARGAHLDGVSGTFRPFSQVGATLLAGVPVVPLLQEHRGRFMAGGRVFWRRSYNTEVGISALHVLDQGRHAAQHIGVDGRITILPRLVLSGMLRWSTLHGSNTVLTLWPRASQWREPAGLPSDVKGRAMPVKDGLWRAIPLLAEADLMATWQPSDLFQAALIYRRTSPSLFIPRSSIFSVFSSEQRDQFGTSLGATLGRWVSLDADAAMLLMPAGVGAQAGARAAARVGPGQATTLGAQSRMLKVPTNAYLMGRVFGSQRLPYGVSSTVDADLYVLENPVHGQRFTTMVSWTNGVAFVRGWDASVQVAAGSSPLATARVEGLMRLSYNAGVPLP